MTCPQVRGWPRPTGPTISLPEKLSYHPTSSEEAEEEEGEPGRLGGQSRTKAVQESSRDSGCAHHKTPSTDGTGLLLSSQPLTCGPGYLPS